MLSALLAAEGALPSRLHPLGPASLLPPPAAATPSLASCSPRSSPSFSLSLSPPVSPPGRRQRRQNRAGGGCVHAGGYECRVRTSLANFIVSIISSGSNSTS